MGPKKQKGNQQGSGSPQQQHQPTSGSKLQHKYHLQYQQGRGSPPQGRWSPLQQSRGKHVTIVPVLTTNIPITPSSPKRVHFPEVETTHPTVTLGTSLGDDYSETLRRIKEVRISGTGIHGNDITVHERAGFTVSTLHMGPGDVIASVVDPRSQRLHVDICEVRKCIHECMYTPQTPGPHTIFVIFKGVNVAGSPFKVMVRSSSSRTSESSLTASGSLGSSSSEHSPMSSPTSHPASPVSPNFSPKNMSSTVSFSPFDHPKRGRRPSLPDVWDDYVTTSRDQLDTGEVLNNAEILQYLSPDMKADLIPCIKEGVAFELGRIIGEGQYGAVWEARYTDDVTGSKLVAAKGLKDRRPSSVNQDLLVDFLNEPILMKKFKHENILELLAVVIHKGSPFIIMPLLPNGNLRNYVRNHNKALGVNVLLGFALNIAKGMEHIAGLKIIHRDLAARNCMLDDHLVVKISDFGLARDILKHDYVMLAKERDLPIRWMAPEVSNTLTFSSSSDVWAFGVTLWELFTFGQWPYENVTNGMLFTYIANGNRLQKPPIAGDAMYCLMLSCWDADPSQRPTFTELSKILSELLDALVLNTVPKGPKVARKPNKLKR